MAKLTRWTMPVFAGSAAQEQTSVFGTMKTSPEYTSDVAAAIDTQAYADGWFEAIEIGYAPFVEDMNSLQRAITYQISYNQQQGIPEWASDTEYYKGSVVKLNTASGMQIYSSLVDSNVGNLVSDNTKWKLLIDSANSYVTTNTTQTISGEKTFTGNNRIIALQNSTVTYNTAPSSDTYTDLSIRDKNGVEMGVLESVRRPDNSTGVRLFAKGADGNYTTALGVYRKADGTSYTSAPTPAAGDNSTNIATTAFVKTAIGVLLSNLYPVGSLYITTQNTSSCPIAGLISGSTWELVATDRALWGGNGWNAHSWINAGLPNITGKFTTRCLMHDTGGQVTSGALSRGYTDNNVQAAAGTDWSGNNQAIDFDASRSNSIYGSSSTVQPPAYRVNVWRRTA